MDQLAFRPIPTHPAYEINPCGTVRRAGRELPYQWDSNQRVYQLWRNNRKSTLSTAQLLSLTFGTPHTDLLDYAVGERHGLAKLTAEKVRAIRAASESSRAIARQFGVDKSTILRIRNRETWRHL